MTDFVVQGSEAYAAGAVRIVPRDILVDNGADAARDWYRGWDTANLAAPIEVEATVTLYKSNRADSPYETTIADLRSRFEEWRAGEPDWQDCPRGRALGYWLGAIEDGAADPDVLTRIHEEV